MPLVQGGDPPHYLHPPAPSASLCLPEQCSWCQWMRVMTWATCPSAWPSGMLRVGSALLPSVTQQPKLATQYNSSAVSTQRPGLVPYFSHNYPFLNLDQTVSLDDVLWRWLNCYCDSSSQSIKHYSSTHTQAFGTTTCNHPKGEQGFQKVICKLSF